MGRTPKFVLDPTVQTRIVQAISLGATQRLAAQYAGISEDTMSNWMTLGGKGTKPYAAFHDAVRQAEGAGAAKWLATIEQAANNGQWQAAAWKLERRYPQEYGRQSLEVVGKDGKELGPAVVIYMPQKQATPTEPPADYPDSSGLEKPDA